MLIHVTFHDDSYDLVMPHRLDELLAAGVVKRFFRLDGWVVIGDGPIRGGDGPYHGPERRRDSTTLAHARSVARFQEALVNLLSLRGVVSKHEISEEIAKSRTRGTNRDSLGETDGGRGGTTSWFILVTYDDDSYDLVMPHRLDALLGTDRVRTFHRSDGWVVVGTDPTRSAEERHDGPERRQEASASALLVRTIQVEKALTVLLDEKGVVSKEDLARELRSLDEGKVPTVASPSSTLIEVEAPDHRLDLVAPDCLQELIDSMAIAAFRRADGWVTLESSTMRHAGDSAGGAGQKEAYHGLERRRGGSVEEHLRLRERIFEARLRLLDRNGTLRVHDFQEELLRLA